MTEKKATQVNPVTDKSANINAAEADAKKKKATVESLLEGTEAGAIWNEIKNRTIDMFALPDQVISMYAYPTIVDPSRLYLLTRASAALPAIETALGKRFLVERADKYVVVSRVTSSNS